jgi:hypothetical protein
MKGPSFGGHGDAKEAAAFFTIVSWSSSSSLCSARKAIEHELLVLLRKSRRFIGGSKRV